MEDIVSLVYFNIRLGVTALNTGIDIAPLQSQNVVNRYGHIVIFIHHYVYKAISNSIENCQ